jgi:hypothetical protein
LWLLDQPAPLTKRRYKMPENKPALTMTPEEARLGVRQIVREENRKIGAGQLEQFNAITAGRQAKELSPIEMDAAYKAMGMASQRLSRFELDLAQKRWEKEHSEGG